MHGNEQSRVFRINWRGVMAALSVAIALALTLVVAQSAEAQTYTVLHGFTGGQDGANPWAGLSMDRAGNLYGTTFFGGYNHGIATRADVAPSLG